MISRRAFVTGSIAASASVLLGGRERRDGTSAASAPQAKASLKLSFVGGTALVDDRGSYLALQLTGYGVEHNGHKLAHNSFMVGPTGTFDGGTRLAVPHVRALPRSVALEKGPHDSVCLLGKDVTITSTNAAPIKNLCKKVAEYDHIAGSWTRKDDWTAGATKPVGSRFKLLHGTLDDGPAVNTNGASARWYVRDKAKEKSLSDVVVYELSADGITISGLNAADIVLSAGKSLVVAVYSGPLHKHGPNHKYKHISHAILLKTIYNVGSTPDAHILPTSDTEVMGMEGQDIRNPCGQGAQVRVPPDSEYCVNYSKLP